jgi:hypothetical protein
VLLRDRAPVALYLLDLLVQDLLHLLAQLLDDVGLLYVV